MSFFVSSENISTSAQQFLAMLNGSIPEQQVFALKKLSQVVDHQWHEISDCLPRIEALIDDENFPMKELAASVASKVFYYLDETEDALRLALEAGNHFNIREETQYVRTLLNTSVDQYTQLRQHNFEKKESVESQLPIDPRMENIINRMFDYCYEENEFKQAIGIALETRRSDKITEAISKSNDVELLNYTFLLAYEVIGQKTFRHEVLRNLLTIFQKMQGSAGHFDYYKIANCQVQLQLPQNTASLLDSLVNSNDHLVAYQIAFDLIDKEDQGFIQAVSQFLSQKEGESEHKDRIGKIISILKGDIAERLSLQFLKKNNHTDMLLINKIKDSIGTRNSMLHASTVWCNGIMNAYTTNDAFLRDNLSWTASATNWNRFSATSSLGMIHMGNKKEALKILNPYFTGVNNPDQQSSPYSTAGAYYAYGLIHANQYSPEVSQFFMDGYRNAGNGEAVQHGVSLGLGLVAIASKDENIYEQLKNTLYNNVDSATIGEAAAYGMGLVMLGSADEHAIEEMMIHAGDSQHEKIIRALSISLAMLMYGKEESADTLIEQMVRSKDSIMRYGGMFGIGLAYAGTGNTSAVKRLLSLAVLDVSDDVKRAALMNLGFVLFRTPKNIPETVRHLAESYNPHLRYGAAMAVGVGCAGTGLHDALKLLAPLTNDQTDFVRQGALMALALVFIQVTEAEEPKVKTIKKLYDKCISDKHEETLSRMGAILSTGLINACGRNASLSLMTRDGQLRQNAIVGMVMFLQYWYWYPLLNFITLAFTPTTFIGLDEDLKVPKSFKFVSNAKPSNFSYPEMLKKEEKKSGEKVETAVLSTTTKVKARKDRKDKAEGRAETPTPDNPMTGQSPQKPEKEKAEKDKAEEVKKEEEEKKNEEEKKVEEEPEFQELSNPSRVVKAQEKVIVFDKSVNPKYAPVLTKRYAGFVMLKQVENWEPGEGQSEQEQFYDDEERDENAPNPDLVSDLDIPKAFEFDEAIQNAS